MARSFERWMAECDAWCIKRWGISIHELPNLDHYAMWEGGVSPTTAVARTIAYSEGR